MTTHSHRNLFIVLILYPCIAINLVTSKKGLSVRFLEGNTWLLDICDLKILIDPILTGSLDFGIPWLYRGEKKFIDQDYELKSLAASCDYVLISQGFDDHAHSPTLRQLAKLRPNLPFIIPPSARGTLAACDIPDKCIEVLTHGGKTTLRKGKVCIVLIATSGALLGPPWQQKENGYIIRPSADSEKSFPSVYYEPHCMYEERDLRRYSPVDYAITPVVAQELPAFTLVAGGQKALDLARLLKSTIIPMANAELNASGLLSGIVKSEGKYAEFKALAKTQGINVVDILAGEEILLS